MGSMWRYELEWTYFMWFRLDLCVSKYVLLSVLAAVSMSLARQHKKFCSLCPLRGRLLSSDIERTQLSLYHSHSYRYPACISCYRAEAAPRMNEDTMHQPRILRFNTLLTCANPALARVGCGAALDRPSTIVRPYFSNDCSRFPIAQPGTVLSCKLAICHSFASLKASH